MLPYTGPASIVDGVGDAPTMHASMGVEGSPSDSPSDSARHLQVAPVGAYGPIAVLECLLDRAARLVGVAAPGIEAAPVLKGAQLGKGSAVSKSPCTQSPNSRMPGVQVMLPSKGDSHISRCSWCVCPCSSTSQLNQSPRSYCETSWRPQAGPTLLGTLNYRDYGDYLNPSSGDVDSSLLLQSSSFSSTSRLWRVRPWSSPGYSTSSLGSPARAYRSLEHRSGSVLSAVP